MKDALGHGSAAHQTGVNAVGHGYTQDRYGVWRDVNGDASGLFARVSSKSGRLMGEYGPHPTREDAAAEAFAKHPKAKSVSTSYQHGRDIRFYNR